MRHFPLSTPLLHTRHFHSPFPPSAGRESKAPILSSLLPQLGTRTFFCHSCFGRRLPESPATAECLAGPRRQRKGGGERGERGGRGECVPSFMWCSVFSSPPPQSLAARRRVGREGVGGVCELGEGILQGCRRVWMCVCVYVCVCVCVCVPVSMCARGFCEPGPGSLQGCRPVLRF